MKCEGEVEENGGTTWRSVRTASKGPNLMERRS